MYCITKLIVFKNFTILKLSRVILNHLKPTNGLKKKEFDNRALFPAQILFRRKFLENKKLCFCQTDVNKKIKKMAVKSVFRPQ